MNVPRRLEERGYSPAAALALLAIAAAVFPAEVGGHGGARTLRVLAAVVAALIAVSVVPFAASMVATVSDPRLLVAAAASAGAAAIHFAVISEHFDEYWLFGIFFVASGIAQLGWAIAALLRPLKPLLLLGVLGNAAIVALWIISRTSGLPLGPDAGEPESSGIPDIAASFFELVVVVATAWYLGGQPRLARGKGARVVASAALLLTAAIVALALSAARLGFSWPRRPRNFCPNFCLPELI